MSVLADRTWFALAVAMYGVSMTYSVFVWRKGFREDNKINYFLILTGFVLHTIAMVERGFSLQRCPVHNLYEATAFISWAMVASYLLLGASSRLRFLGAFASPVLVAMGVFALMPSLDKPGPGLQFTGGWLSLHVALFALAYGSLGLSSVAGVMYLTQEHDLKFHKLRAVISRFPPLQRLESVMLLFSVSGFVLLTVALGASAVLFRQVQGTFLTGDPKILWSLLVWGICMGLLIARWKFNRGGRGFAWGAIALFVFVALTFWGSSLMSPIHNDQHKPAAGLSSGTVIPSIAPSGGGSQ